MPYFLDGNQKRFLIVFALVSQPFPGITAAVSVPSLSQIILVLHSSWWRQRWRGKRFSTRSSPASFLTSNLIPSASIGRASISSGAQMRGICPSFTGWLLRGQRNPVFSGLLSGGMNRCYHRQLWRQRLPSSGCCRRRRIYFPGRHLGRQGRSASILSRLFQ